MDELTKANLELVVAKCNHLSQGTRAQFVVWSRFSVVVAMFVASRDQPENKTGKYSNSNCYIVFYLSVLHDEQ